MTYTPPTCSKCGNPAKPVAYSYQTKYLCPKCWLEVLKKVDNTKEKK